VQDAAIALQGDRVDAAGNVHGEVRVLGAVSVETGKVGESEPADGRAANENFAISLNRERVRIADVARANDACEIGVERAVRIQARQAKALLAVDILEKAADHDPTVRLQNESMHQVIGRADE
jgi:hypothetical protein